MFDPIRRKNDMFKRNTMYLFDPYWDEKSKTWNAYCSRSEFDFPAKSSYESLFFRMLVLPFNKLPITYKVHVKRFKKSKSYLFLIHLEKRRAFFKTKKPKVNIGEVCANSMTIGGRMFKKLGQNFTALCRVYFIVWHFLYYKFVYFWEHVQ